MDSILDLVELVVGVATVAAAAFAGWEIRQFVVERRETDRVEAAGVGMMWRTISAPHSANFRDRRATEPPITESEADQAQIASMTEAPGGLAAWEFEFVLSNPGRLPIDNIHCEVRFDREIARLHWDGLFDPPSRTLILEQAVVTGGASRTWKRKLIAPWIDGVELGSQMRCEVTFTDVRGQRHANHWPRQQP